MENSFNQDKRTVPNKAIYSENSILIDLLFKSGIYNSVSVKNKYIKNEFQYLARYTSEECVRCSQTVVRMQNSEAQQCQNLKEERYIPLKLVFEDDPYSNRLIQKIQELNLNRSHTVDIGEIKKAICYAKKYHGEQKRQSGEPYYYHPIEVAYMVTDNCFKTDIIVTSILHDIVEDTNFTVQMVETVFGSIVASQVKSLTRNTMNGKLSVQKIIEPLYKQGKVDVLIIKLFDRLHNMRTISFKSEEKQYKTTLETMKIFVPLAQYLQLPKVKQELIDICMTILSFI